MTVQVTTTPPGSSERYSSDPTFATVPLVPTGPGVLQFQDVLPDGSLGPIWGVEDLEIVSTDDDGIRVRFPDGTEVVLQGTPQEIAGLFGEIAPAAGDEAGAQGGETGESGGGSSGAFNAFVVDNSGTVFGLAPDGSFVPLPEGSGPTGLPDENDNLILTLDGDTSPADSGSSATPASLLAATSTLSGGLFTPLPDVVDLSGSTSALDPAFGTPFASDGNISNALAGDDTVQLANVGEPNFVDTFFGGEGNDTLSGGNGGDVISGDDPGAGVGGDDTLSGNAGNDTLLGGPGDDSLFGGGGGGDVLDGGPGNDFVDVGGGNLNRERIIISDREDGIDTIANFDNFGQFSETLDLDALFDDLAGDLGVTLSTAARIDRLSLVGAGTNTTNVFIDQSAAGDGSDQVQIAVIQSTFATVFIGVGSGASVFDDVAVGA